MRWSLLAGVASSACGQALLQLAVKVPQLLLQQIELLLLPINGEIEFVHQILGQAEANLEFDETVFHY